MKPIHLHIKTLIADNIPVPSGDLIADLVDSVLKVPGLRVQSVEIVKVEGVAVVTRRVRNVDPLGTKPRSTPPPPTTENLNHANGHDEGGRGETLCTMSSL